MSFRASSTGTLAHELVVLPLAKGQAIAKSPTGSDARVSETGSLGEASRNRGGGEGQGIAPGSVGWVTLTLLCNFQGITPQACTQRSMSPSNAEPA